MGFEFEPKMLVRGGAAVGPASAGEELSPVLTPGREQIVVAGLPPLTELVRLGGSYLARNTSGVAPLTAVPTTTAGFSLWNGETGANPKSYVIDEVTALEGVIDATQQNQLSVWAMINASQAAITAVAGRVVSLSGKGTSTAGLTRARIATGLTVVDDGWMPIGGESAGSAALAGSIWRVSRISLDGSIILPPGALFSLQAAKVAATAAQMFYVIRWHEVALTLG